MNMQTKEHIRCRITLPVIIGGALTVAALSTGSTVFLTGALLVWLLLLTVVVLLLWIHKLNKKIREQEEQLKNYMLSHKE